MIWDVAIVGGIVSFILVLIILVCFLWEFIVEDCEKVVKILLGVEKVEVKVMVEIF